GTDGLRERVFDAASSTWGAWVVRGVPTNAQHPPALWEDFGADLFADSGFFGERARAVAVWSHPGSSVAPDRHLALPTDDTPYGTPAGFTNNTWDTQDWMRPMTVVPSGDGRRITVFGA